MYLYGVFNAAQALPHLNLNTTLHNVRLQVCNMIN